MNATIALGAVAPDPSLASRPLSLMLVMTALSLIPFALLLMTSFVKISVVLSILKSALGSAQVPPGQVVTGLALVLTLFVMAPVGQRMYQAMQPALAHTATADVLGVQSTASLLAAGDRAKEPLRDFLLRHSTTRDRTLFHGLALRLRTPAERAQITDRDLQVVVPSFLTSELRRAFEIGFLLFIPFLIIDLVISNLLLALGMHMLSPTTVSLPFKLLLFVVADGWQLLLRGLVESYV
jgi:type III secretion protein R